jgi:hypothetical protein
LLAKALYAFLRDIDRQFTPFYSPKIPHGTEWQALLTNELRSSFGIICVTRETLYSPWVNFETGVLAAKPDNVAPLLFGLLPEDVPSDSPLQAFQSRIIDRETLWDLVKRVNGWVNRAVPEHQRWDELELQKSFDKHWQGFNEHLQGILKRTAQAPPQPKPLTTRLPVLGANDFCHASSEFHQHRGRVYQRQESGALDCSNLFYIFINTTAFAECRASVLSYFETLILTGEPVSDVSVWSLLGAAELLVKFRTESEVAWRIESSLLARLGQAPDRKGMLEPVGSSKTGLEMINIGRESVIDPERNTFDTGLLLTNDRMPDEARSIKVFIKLTFDGIPRDKLGDVKQELSDRVGAFRETVESYATSVRRGKKEYMIIEAHFPCGRFPELRKLSAALEKGLRSTLLKETYVAYECEVLRTDARMNAPAESAV